METPKGIETRTNKKGKSYYRVATSVNGKNIRTAWDDAYDKVAKDLEKYLALRVKLPTKNQYTKNTKDIRVEDFLRQYHEHAKSQYSVNYALSTKRTLDKVFRDHMPYPISEVPKIDLIEKLQGFKKSTAKVVIAHFGSLNKFADEKEYPFRVNVRLLLTKIKNFPASKEKISFLDATEVSRLFNYLQGNDDYKIFKQMVIMSLYNGLRVGEILSLRYRNIDLDKEVIHVLSTINYDGTFKEGTKNGETRVIPMSRHVKTALTEILAERPNINFDDLLFPVNYAYALRKMNALRKAKVLHPDYTFHTFRHSFASIFFKTKGTDYDSLLKLQQIMGHSDLKMSLHYVHLYDTFNRNILEDLSFNGAEKLSERRISDEKKEYLDTVISLVDVGDRVLLEIPYNAATLDVFKRMGGFWNVKVKAWDFPINAKEGLLVVLKERYGYEPPVDLNKELADIKKMLAELSGRK